MPKADKIKNNRPCAGGEIDKLNPWKTPSSKTHTGLQPAVSESQLPQMELNEQLLKAKAQLQQETAKRKLAEKKLSKCRNEVRTLTSELAMTEERQRQRLAQDLHDTVAQCLAGCRCKLETLLADSVVGFGHGQVDECIGFIDQAIKQTRLLMFEFYPWILNELGLQTALRSLAQRIQQAHGIQVECIGDGPADSLGKDMRELLFRVTRELVINVVKHAKARHVTISIRSANNQIRIGVADDGIGFDVAGIADQQEKNNGFGLFSVRERVGCLGGRLELVSHPGKGTRAAVVIPGQWNQNPQIPHPF